MVKHRSKPVLFCPARFYCYLNRLRNGDTERTGMVRSAIQVTATSFCAWRGAGKDLGTISFHDDAAVGFAQVGSVDHKHFQVHFKHLARHRQGAAPLTRPGLSGHRMRPADFVEESLGNGRIQFVRACRRFSFIFKVNMSGSVQFFLKTTGTDQRGWSVKFIDLAHIFWDRYKTLHGRFLLD